MTERSRRVAILADTQTDMMLALVGGHVELDRQGCSTRSGCPPELDLEVELELHW